MSTDTVYQICLRTPLTCTTPGAHQFLFQSVASIYNTRVQYSSTCTCIIAYSACSPDGAIEPRILIKLVPLLFSLSKARAAESYAIWPAVDNHCSFLEGCENTQQRKSCESLPLSFRALCLITVALRRPLNSRIHSTCAVAPRCPGWPESKTKSSKFFYK